MVVVGIDVGAHFHVAAVAGHGDWKRWETLKFDSSRAGFEALKGHIGACARDCSAYINGAARPAVVPKNFFPDGPSILGTTAGAAPGQGQSEKNLGTTIRVAIEPTGRFYSEAIGHYCEAQGWELCWIDNKTLHDYRSMMKAPSKSDAMDARLLAHYLQHQHETVFRPDDQSKHLRYLYQELRQVHKQRTQYKNRLRQILKVTWPEVDIKDNGRLLQLLEMAPSARDVANLSHDEINAFIKNTGIASNLLAMAQDSIGYAEEHYIRRTIYNVRMIKGLDTRISELEEEISRLVHAHPDGPIVMSLPGIGPTGAAAIIGAYGDVSRYPDRRTFKRKLGVAANERESGTSVYSTFINRRSSKYARTALHLASLTCLKTNSNGGYFREYFENRCQDGIKGHNRRLLGRLKGKLAEVLYCLLKRREPYDPGKHSQLPVDDVQSMPGIQHAQT